MTSYSADTLDLHADDLISDMWSRQGWSNWSTDNSARVPSVQGWYWTPEWQQMEREAEDDLAAGRCVDFDDLDALIASLELASDEALRIVDQVVATEKRRRALCAGGNVVALSPPRCSVIISAEGGT